MNDGARSRARVEGWVRGPGGQPGAYGFARRPDGGTVFIHRTALRGWPDLEALSVGDLIEFSCEPPKAGEKHANALDVAVVDSKEDGARWLPGERHVMTAEEKFKVREPRRKPKR